MIRNLEIIGEASNKVPDEIQHKFPSVKWREMVALQNIVAHVYFSISDEIIWDVVQNKIPELFFEVEVILVELDG